MKKFVDWDELTLGQRCHATEQYVELEAHQLECSVEDAAKSMAGYPIAEINIGEDSTLQELTSTKRIEIDTDDEHYVYVDL